MVGAGGAMGAVLRYWLSLFIVKHTRALPAATLAVNVLGSVALGVVLGMLFGSVPSGGVILADRQAVFLAVGLCGSFTTYSTFAADTAHLLRRRNYWTATYHVALMLVGILAAFLAGFALAR